MAPGSAVAATGRFKLLSLASFGLISGACLFIGYYLLRKYRQATHQKTDDSTEEELATESVNTIGLHVDRIPDQADCRGVVSKTAEENGSEENELKEKVQGKKEKEDQVRQINASKQHESASGTLEVKESDRQGTPKDELTGADVTESFLNDDSSLAVIVGDIVTEIEQREDTLAEIRREDKKTTTAKTTSQETESEPRHVTTPAEVQTNGNDATVRTKEKPISETYTAVKRAPLTAQKPPNSEETVTKTVEAATDKEQKSEETIECSKSTDPASGYQQQSGAIKHVKVISVHTEKQLRSEKVLEVESPESTVQNTSNADRNETKPANATAENEAISETTRNAETTETANAATGQHSETLKHIKSTTAASDDQTLIRDARVAATSLVGELRSGKEQAKSPETSDDREDKSEFPLCGKSQIPESLKRLADNRSDFVLESITSHKDESNSPVLSPTGTNQTKSVWSEKPGLHDSKDNVSGIGKRIPLNVNAATFHPNKPLPADGTAQDLPSAVRSKDEHAIETNTFEGSKINNVPGQKISQTDEHVAESDDPSTQVARPSKSLLPLTPPPDTNKQSRRQRDRGIRGSQKAEPASEGGVTVETQSMSSRHRWPPLEDKTLDRVEVDTSSQQVSWKTNKKPSSAQNPWSSPHAVHDATSSVQGRKTIEFDDNFVDPVPTKVPSPNQKSELTVPSDVTKQSSLLNATPDCVLERKPLISEDDDDEDDLDDDGEGVKKQFVRRDSTKNGSEDVTPQSTGEQNSNDDAVKLVEIDQNCIGSLIGLTGAKADPDVRLASLRALVNLSWTSEKHSEYPPVLDQLCANIDSDDPNLKLESLRVLANLSKNPAMVPHLLAAKAPSNLLKLLQPETSEDLLVNWLTVLDDILWTSKELCLTFASLPPEQRAASPETLYTGLYGLKNSRILKSRIFVLSRHKSQQVTYLASRIYSCLTS